VYVALDALQALAFALTNLDREELEEMPIVIGRCGAGPIGAIEQPVGDVEPD
jgi:hypothetical protein